MNTQSLFHFCKSLINFHKNARLVSLIKKARLSSYPFVSGDGFRMLADITLDHSWEFKEQSPPIFNQDINDRPLIVFVALSAIESIDNQKYLLEWAKTLRVKTNVRIKYVLHNGDSVPPNNFYYSLLEFCTEIFSVNVLDFIPSVHPIPIGLENLHHLNNGLLNDFLCSTKLRSSSSIIEKRDALVFSCFNPKTNPKERVPLLNLLNSHNLKFDAKLHPDEFKRRVRNSYYVMCPTGNGLDTHRTWESIALGAVPVLKEGTLASSLANNLPILMVKDWEEFLSLSSQDKLQEFDKIINKPIDSLFLFYWQIQIMKN